MTKLPSIPKKPAAARKLDAELHAAFYGWIQNDLPEVYAALKELALGAWVEEISPDGTERRVYRKPPDFHAAKYLVDHEVGTPVKRSESTVNEEKTYTMRLEAKKQEYEGAARLSQGSHSSTSSVEGEFRALEAAKEAADEVTSTKLTAMRAQIAARRVSSL